jgi:2-polyprenyl-6-methoxyphenol hydroxylase-like FAD-dependent oxidoreductase
MTAEEVAAMRSDVLIAGAGPTGLVLALWLTRLGVKVRIIDKDEEAGTTSRALAVQARTLELYSQIDLAQAVIDRGHKVPTVNLWVGGAPKARLDFSHIGGSLTRYAFLQIFPQDEHENLLIERLGGLGVTVERQTELIGFSEGADHVVAELKGADGATQSCEALYIAGCDGAHSVVRHVIGSEFTGSTYQKIFYVADVEASGPPINGELHVDLDEADFLAVFPLAAQKRVRLIGVARDDSSDGSPLRFEDVGNRAIGSMKLKIEKVNWFSIYRVHHRVAAHFRKGRAFLLGDAAHIHSPVGGQGMNTGIGDAINLAWKLAAAVAGQAPDTLLDSYEAERIGFARRLVATTDRAFTLVTSPGRLAQLVRTQVAPALMSRLAKFDFFRRFMFRTVSQIMLNYRDGPLSAGEAGTVHGGDRLPWAPVDGVDNFASLSLMKWQVHVYGTAKTELTSWCAEHRIPFQVFAWSRAYGAAGLAQDAAYLLRPDSYVALADASGSPDTIKRYCAERGLTIDG